MIKISAILILLILTSCIVEGIREFEVKYRDGSCEIIRATKFTPDKHTFAESTPYDTYTFYFGNKFVKMVSGVRTIKEL